MVDLVLMALMIAALCGMVICNRKHRKGFRYQILALGLLTVVIASGGIFMYRLNSHKVLGLPLEAYESELDNRLRNAQGFVVGNYIRTRCGGDGKVLLISPETTVQLNQALLGQFRAAGLNRLIHEKIHFPDDNPRDTLINPVAERAAETSGIDSAVARHPDARAVVLAGIAPSGASLQRLKLYKIPAGRRPRLIVLGLTNLTDWTAGQLRKGFIDALVVTDPAKVMPANGQLPDNPVALFDSCYTFITKDNLERNHRFFPSRK